MQTYCNTLEANSLVKVERSTPFALTQTETYLTTCDGFVMSEYQTMNLNERVSTPFVLILVIAIFLLFIWDDKRNKK
jgi:hypothetical protein